MKIIAVDADTAQLALLADSLREVFTEAEVVRFDNGLKSFQYFKRHESEIALIFFPLTIRPFDGFKFSGLVERSSFSGSVVFTTQTDNEEIRDLIRLNGANRHIPKPVTPEKLRALAVMEQEMCLDRFEEFGDCGCKCCVYHWCENHPHGKSSEDHSEPEPGNPCDPARS